MIGTGSSHCKICADPRVKSINRALLSHIPMTKVAAKTGLNLYALRRHLHKHLPWLPQDRKKAVTVEEQMAELKHESMRLQALAENGEESVNFAGALAALRERRMQLELEARMKGELEGSHKQKLAAPKLGDELEISFAGGRAQAKVVEQ